MLVGGRNDEVGPGVGHHDAVYSPSHAGSGVPVDRLCQDMLHGDLGQLAADNVKVFPTGIYIDVLPGKDADKAVEGLLELRPP